MTTLMRNLTDYVNDDEIGVGFVASVLAIVLGSSFFFMYNLLILPNTDTIRTEKHSTQEVQVHVAPMLPPSPLKPVSEPTL